MGAKLKRDIGTEGANAEYAAHEVKDWQQSQKKSVGRGWAKAKPLRRLSSRVALMRCRMSVSCGPMPHAANVRPL